jgi:hypothetical protein
MHEEAYKNPAYCSCLGSLLLLPALFSTSISKGQAKQWESTAS